MADGDPTVATPSDLTQPLPATPERQPEPPPGPPSGWRPAQVAVVALLALLLGGSGGALLYFLTDDEPPATTDLADGRTTTTTTTEDPEQDDASSTTTDPETDPTTSVSPSPDEGSQGGGDQEGGQSRGGETVVGNSIFTATYQSNQDRATDDIDVDDDWKIRWDVPTGSVTIDVLDAGGAMVETIDAQGRGERRFAEGGTYRVEIDTDGSRYTVVITDGP